MCDINICIILNNIKHEITTYYHVNTLNNIYTLI